MAARRSFSALTCANALQMSGIELCQLALASLLKSFNSSFKHLHAVFTWPAAAHLRDHLSSHCRNDLDAVATGRAVALS